MSTAVATDVPRLKARYHDEIKAKLEGAGASVEVK